MEHGHHTAPPTWVKPMRRKAVKKAGADKLRLLGEVHALEEGLEARVGAEVFQTWASVYVGH